MNPRLIAATLATTASLVLVPFAAFANPGHGHGHDCDERVARGHWECPPPVVEPPTPPPVDIPDLFNLILGTPDRDRLPGTFERDAILAFGGNDRLLGRKGADRLYGGRGNDRLRAGLDADRDVLNGGLGARDVCIGGTEDVYRSCEVRIVL